MSEEVEEFLENPSYEEAADILEVLRGFAALHNLEMEKIQHVASTKAVERGGFFKGIILEVVGDKND